jgi:glutamyl-tRNA(Gln) amidotransferase subunit E
MPELTHNEAFRQYALLAMRDLINAKIPDKKSWKPMHVELTEKDFDFSYEPLKNARNQGHRILAVNLPLFQGFLSHFTQPGKCFANEISDRLKVIACIEKPNMVHSEQFKKVITPNNMNRIQEFLKAGEEDAQIIIWGNDADLKTALETIEERCLMAFDGIPPETRKGLPDGTTIFERVLPGADRMYPDTDSAPIPLEDAYIEERSKNLPVDISVRMQQLDQNNVPEDTHEYLLKNNMIPFMEQVEKDLGLSFRYIGIFLGHTLKHIEGQYPVNKEFTLDHVYKLFAYLKEHNLEPELAKRMIHKIYQHPKMDLDSVLNEIKFKRYEEEDIYAKVPFLKKKFSDIRISSDEGVDIKWIMGELRKIALGNVGMKSLKNYVETCKE